jgi:Flp pilus assembly protein TadG
VPRRSPTRARPLGRQRRAITFTSDERGAALVEFALAMPFLLLMLFGIMEFAVAFWVRHTVTHAAREGARFAIVRGGDSASPADDAAVATYVRSRVPLETVQVTTTWPTTKAPGAVVRVRVAYPYQPVTGFGVIGPVTIASTSEMVISY